MGPFAKRDDAAALRTNWTVRAWDPRWCACGGDTAVATAELSRHAAHILKTRPRSVLFFETSRVFPVRCLRCCSLCGHFASGAAAAAQVRQFKEAGLSKSSPSLRLPGPLPARLRSSSSSGTAAPTAIRSSLCSTPDQRPRPRDLVVRRVPVAFNASFRAPKAHLKVWASTLHAKVFRAIHVEKLKLAKGRRHFAWVGNGAWIMAKFRVYQLLHCEQPGPPRAGSNGRSAWKVCHVAAITDGTMASMQTVLRGGLPGGQTRKGRCTADSRWSLRPVS